MICGKCWNKPVAKGIKDIECVICEDRTTINIKYKDICFECSDEHNICQSCGENYLQTIEWVHINTQGE